jgi:hypothetical protein
MHMLQRKYLFLVKTHAVESKGFCGTLPRIVDLPYFLSAYPADEIILGCAAIILSCWTPSVTGNIKL